MSDAVKIRVEPRDPAEEQGDRHPGRAAAAKERADSRRHLRAQAGGRADHADSGRRLADDQDAGTPRRARPGRNDRDRPDPRRAVGPPRQGDPPPRLRPGQRRGDHRDRGPARVPRARAPGSRPAGSSSTWSTACAITCRAGAIPDSIKVDVSHLQVDEGIHVRDLTLPPDVTVDADPDLLLVHVVTRAVEAEPTAEAGRRGRRPSPRSSSPSARKKRRKNDPRSLVLIARGRPSRRGRPIRTARSRRRAGATVEFAGEPRRWRR